MELELDTILDRFTLTDCGHWRDSVTGRLVPVISGSDGEDDGDNEEGGDDDDDGDDNDAEMSRLQAEMTKQSRAGAKKALRELARKHGFGSRAELESFLEANAAGEDEGDSEVEEEAPGSEDKAKTPTRREPITNDPVRQRELRLEVREALFDLDVAPSKAKLATATVVGLVDLSDPDLDAEDIAEAVRDMKTSEPSWFLSADGGDDDDKGRVVPGASGRKPKTKINKSADEIAREMYEIDKARNKPRARLVGGSTS